MNQEPQTVPAAPPGWYQDPSSPDHNYWWTGYSWSGDSEDLATLRQTRGARPEKQRPWSVAAIISLCLFPIPFIGLILACVGIVSTARSGDRRGRVIAWIGMALNVTMWAVIVVAVVANPDLT